MSNSKNLLEFYNFLADKIIEHFSGSCVNSGNAYYLCLDDDESIKCLYEAFSSNRFISGNVSEQFNYTSEINGERHHNETILLNCGDNKVIVASVISQDESHITDGHLVYLRERIRGQTCEFEGMSILFLINNRGFDSVTKGCENLQNPGMPLNPMELCRILKDNVNASRLSDSAKCFVNFDVQKRLEEMPGRLEDLSIFAFADDFAILTKGEMEAEDYGRLGLFKDQGFDIFLEQLKNDKIKASKKENKIFERLTENADAYSLILKCHQSENLEPLEKIYDKKGFDLVRGVDWADADYDVLRKSEENNNSKRVPVLNNVEIDGIEHSKIRDNKDTPAGRRVKHVILYNPLNESRQVHVNLGFDVVTKNLEFSVFKEKVEPEKRKANAYSIKLDVAPKTVQFTSLNINWKNPNKSKEKGSSKVNYSVNICVVPFRKEELNLDNFIYSVNTRNKLLELDYIDASPDFSIGCGDKVIINDLDNVELSDISQKQYILKKDILNDNLSPDGDLEENHDVLIKVLTNSDSTLLLSIHSKSETIPIQNITRLECDKLIHKEDFEIDGIKIVQPQHPEKRYYYGSGNVGSYNLEKSIGDRLKLEQEIIKSNILYGILEDERIITPNNDIPIPQKIKEAYLNILRYFKEKKTTPLLSIVDEEQISLYKIFINEYITEIKKIRNSNQRDRNENYLLLLGSLKQGDTLLLSPFNIINIAYRFTFSLEISGDSKFSYPMIDRLNGASIVPFMYLPTENTDFSAGEYRCNNKNNMGYWLSYSPNNSNPDTIINNLKEIVLSKLENFVSCYPIFFASAEMPIRINAIGLGSNIEFFKAVLSFVEERLSEKDATFVIPVEIKFYQKKGENNPEWANLFFSIETVDEVNNIFGDILHEKSNTNPKYVLEILQKSIRYFVKPDTGDYDYAHITFYNNEIPDTFIHKKMSDLPTGMQLGGLINSLACAEEEGQFNCGFGAKDIESESLLNELACLLNEYVYNLKDHGQSSYDKEVSIISHSQSAFDDNKRMQKMYGSSYWVTFINPKHSLDYFIKKQDGNMLIVHYGDSTDSGDFYSAITVTEKLDIYKSIVRKQLLEYEINVGDDEENVIEGIIKLFSSINGEWLLKLIVNQSSSSGSSKMISADISHVAATKLMLAYLWHKDIIWVPISMEEILRVAGIMRLSGEKGDTIFSKKDLGISGPLSDDILFIGIEKNSDPIKVHFYPLEIKRTGNEESSINKGIDQISRVFHVYLEFLYSCPTDEDKLRKKYYRNFFMQRALSSANNIYQNGLIDEEDYQYIQSIKKQLLNDDFILSYSLYGEYSVNSSSSDEVDGNRHKYLGMGSVVSFDVKNGNNFNEAEEKDAPDTCDDLYPKFVKILKMNNTAISYGIKKPQLDLRKEIQEGRWDFSPDELISSLDLKSLVEPDFTQENTVVCNVDAISTDGGHDVDSLDDKQDSQIDSIDDKSISPESERKSEQIRVLIGNIHGKNKKVYWEFGNKQLSNRHLLILGKSGSGKSYLIQCLLLELSKCGISSVIIDYTDGFKKSQLEPEFKEILKDKVNQRIVARDKFPLNPFKRNQKELDEGEFILEDASDVAERVQTTLSSIYSFGQQQNSSLYNAVKRGVELYGDKMTLSRLREILLEEAGTSSNNPAATTESKMRLLFDKDPFSYEDFDWEDIENNDGVITIIQLTSLMPDIQKVISEFILWDLWYYKMRLGNKDKPLPVILDEAQNLDHSKKSPCAKILTEGRKFGWSGWFATQFMYGGFDQDERKRLENTGQKIFFLPPDSEISQVASMLSKDSADKKASEIKLSGLEKGRCIAYGLYVDEFGSNRGNRAIEVDITPINERGYT